MNVRVDRIDQYFEPPPTTRLDRVEIPPQKVWGDVRRASFYVIEARGNAGSIAINRLLKTDARCRSCRAHSRFLVTPTRTGFALVVESRASPRPSRKSRTISAFALPRPAAARRRMRDRSAARAWAFQAVGRKHRRRLDALAARAVRVRVREHHRRRRQARWPTGALRCDRAARHGRRAHDSPATWRARCRRSTSAGWARGRRSAQTVRRRRRHADRARFVERAGDDAAGRAAARRHARLSPNDYFCPGSVVKITLEPDPLTYGLPRETAGFCAFNTAFDIAAPSATSGTATARIIGRYARQQRAAQRLARRRKGDRRQSAMVEVKSGQGRAVLFAFRPQHRGQAHATFRLFFNAIHIAR